MTQLIDYVFYNGEYITNVDREKELITVYERGGWSRDYKLTFKQLLSDAKDWEVQIDLNDHDRVIAEIATNIILANNAASHNLDPYEYVPRSDKMTDPRHKAAITNFEKLFDTYTPEQIIKAMSKDKKEILKKSLTT